MLLATKNKFNNLLIWFLGCFWKYIGMCLLQMNSNLLLFKTLVQTFSLCHNIKFNSKILPMPTLC